MKHFSLKNLIALTILAVFAVWMVAVFSVVTDE